MDNRQVYGGASFSIKHNNLASNDPCAICGARTDPWVGLELFLRDSFALVCHECVHKYAPEFLARLYAFRDELHFMGDDEEMLF
jgi:hypothetical protein